MLSSTGALSVGETQCALLSQEFGFQHISLEGILREKSEDQTYLHAEFVRDCLKEEVDVPVGLVVSLLERKIEEGMNEGRRWSLVHGFPKSMEQVLEFERKVSIHIPDRTSLKLVGPKNKLHTISEPLRRRKPCGKPGPTLWG